MAQVVVIELAISAEDYLAHYQGVAKAVVAKATDGRTVRFPSSILQPFVTREGIRGRFSIQFDSKGKFQTISRLA